ncbi:MAG: T9SS type A sorting domain-containing protein, partial [bacterium]
DGGSTLDQKTLWYTNSSTSMSHGDIHYLGFNNGILYCGSDGGAYKSTDEGDTWSDMNATLSTLQMESADYDQTNILRMYGGTQDNNKLKTSNGGAQWRQNTTGDGGYTLVDQQSPNYVYGAYVGGSLQRSTDFGETYEDIMPETGGLFYNPYEMSPSNPQVIVYCSNNIWKTTTARTATSSSGWALLLSPTNTPSAIAISGSNDQHMYVGTWAGEVLCTRDNFNTSVSTFPATDFVSDLAIDPDNDSICYATTTGFTDNSKVYKTTDAGGGWINITGNLPNIPVNTIILIPATLSNPLSAQTIMVGTDLGCYISTNDGASWTSFNNNLPKVEVFDLKVHTAAGYVIAATHGRGVYMADIHQALPIQLASITARAIGGSRVKIDWQTISEVNNYGFEIERKLPGQTQFSGLANSFVPGHGTTVEPHLYAFTDTTASPAQWVYRLKQIDLDGTMHYSQEVPVTVLTGVSETRLPTLYGMYQNYPNPFNPSTQIKYDLPGPAKVSLVVYDVVGRKVAELVNTTVEAGYHAAKWNASDVSSGVYYARLIATDNHGNERLNKVIKLLLMK